MTPILRAYVPEANTWLDNVAFGGPRVEPCVMMQADPVAVTETVARARAMGLAAFPGMRCYHEPDHVWDPAFWEAMAFKLRALVDGTGSTRVAIDVERYRASDPPVTDPRVASVMFPFLDVVRDLDVEIYPFKPEDEIHRAIYRYAKTVTYALHTTQRLPTLRRDNPPRFRSEWYRAEAERSSVLRFRPDARFRAMVDDDYLRTPGELARRELAGAQALAPMVWIRFRDDLDVLGSPAWIDGTSLDGRNDAADAWRANYLENLCGDRHAQRVRWDSGKGWRNDTRAYGNGGLRAEAGIEIDAPSAPYTLSVTVNGGTIGARRPAGFGGAGTGWVYTVEDGVPRRFDFVVRSSTVLVYVDGAYTETLAARAFPKILMEGPGNIDGTITLWGRTLSEEEIANGSEGYPWGFS